MNRTLVALWSIISLSIIAVLSLAFVWNAEREKSARLGLAELMVGQLEPYNRDIARVLQEYQQRLERLLEEFEPSSQASIARLTSDPLVGQLVVVEDVGAKGALIYPDLARTPLSDRSLITDAVLWLRDSNLSGRDRSNSVNALSTASQAVQRVSPPVSVAPRASDASESHWTTWYHQRGLILGYWNVCSNNTISMAIIPRGRWLADIVAALPESSQPKREPEQNSRGTTNRVNLRDDALVQLRDFEGNLVAQWGNLEVGTNDRERDAELAVIEPLEGWRLQLFLSDSARDLAVGKSYRWVSYAGATGFAIALCSLGALISLQVQRQLRLAQQQVSFVNQVSHELRTPLTNIRMYADLTMTGLQGHPPETVEDEIQRVGVIQQECGRLSRLIENVLSFARLGRNQNELRRQKIDDVESLIDEVLEPFLPQFEEQAFIVDRVRGVQGPVELDRLIFEQILVNLVSNAIKYASDGKRLKLESALSDGKFHLWATDNGPGIPKRMRGKIFEPFVRVSNRLEDPTGTGIGLSIARSLARLHGGDIVLEPTPVGCRFHVQLKHSDSKIDYPTPGAG